MGGGGGGGGVVVCDVDATQPIGRVRLRTLGGSLY